MENKLDYKNLISQMERRIFWVAGSPALLQTIYPFMIGFIKTNLYFRFGFELAIATSKNFYVNQHLDEKENLQITEKIVKLYSQNKLKKEYQIWQKFQREFYKKIEELNRAPFEKFSDRKLLRKYLNFLNIFIKTWTIPLILEGTAIFTEKKLFPEFKTRFKNLNLDIKTLTQYFTQLSQPETISFLSQERMSFLRISLLAKRDKEILSYLRKRKIKISELREINPEFSRAFKNHCQKFYWIHFGYIKTEPIAEREFLTLLKKEIESKSEDEFKKEFKKFLNFKQNIKRQKKEIIKKLRLSKEIENKFKAISFFGFWVDERKETTIRGNEILIKFLRKFERRIKINHLLIGLALPAEILKILKEVKNFRQREKWKERLKQRKKGYVFVCRYGRKPVLFEKEESQKFFEVLFKKEKVSEVKVLEGMVVSRGEKDYVIGKVKVILDPSKKKIVRNEILVTSMTRPDFTPLLKEAKAIITDEGGMTCHAAIVSRELGIPCIVGTKKATKVLRDGDVVELRLNHGKILILSAK